VGASVFQVCEVIAIRAPIGVPALLLVSGALLVLLAHARNDAGARFPACRPPSARVDLYHDITYIVNIFYVLMTASLKSRQRRNSDESRHAGNWFEMVAVAFAGATSLIVAQRMWYRGA
jgi:hypothetical protein